jgi:hypothetical protein
VDTSRLVGFFEASPALFSAFAQDVEPEVIAHTVSNRTVLRIHDFLTADEVAGLLVDVESNRQIPVGRDGYVKNFSEGQDVCSRRSTLYSEQLASMFFQRIKKHLSPEINRYVTGEHVFSPVGVNPALRFIDYPAGGWLVPHYDFPYRVSDGEMTLYSLVIFLTSNPADGATRFIHEYREHDDSDWSRKAEESEVLLSLNPQAGDAILFPHDMLHEGQFTSQRKVILRTDIMFRE